MKRTIVFFVLLFALIPVYAQEAFIAPGDNLVLDGIPQIPQSIADTVSRYTEFRSAGIASWHPTKLEMLIGTRFADTAQFIMSKCPEEPGRSSRFPQNKFRELPSNPKNPAYFIFSKDVGGGEWYQNFRYDIESGAITLLTDGESRNSLGVWARDGSKMAYISTRRTNKTSDLYIVDPSNPSSDRLLAENQSGRWVYPLDWSPDGKWIAVMEAVSINESYLWLFDSQTGAKTLITPRDNKNQIFYGGGEFSHDGKGLYVTTDRDSEFCRLAYLDLETKEHRFLAETISWDVDDFRLSPNGKTIAFVVNEDGFCVLHLMDITGKELPVPTLPTGLISGIQWHPSGTHLGFNQTSARSSTDAYSLEIATGKVEQWTFSESGGLNTASFPQAELIRWKSFDGRMILGFLYRPQSSFSGKRPVIVNIHGGPESQARPGFLGADNFYLNELGIVIIRPNIRGSSGYGKTFLKLDNGFKREDSYKDIAALLDWIKEQPDLDGERIMVTGGSYGGHMTLAVATHYSEKIRCAVDVVGMSSLVTFLENTESYRRDHRRAEYGDERNPKMREFMEQIAAMNNLDKLTKPLFVIQGKNDPRVPATESEQIVAALKKSNIPVWYLMATDEGHGFAKKKNQSFQFYATVMFIKKYLLQ